MGVEKNGSNGERFPLFSKVFERYRSGNPSWLRAIAYFVPMLVAMMIDFPGAIIKTTKVIKERLRQPPYQPK